LIKPRKARIRIQIAPEQKAALERLADERDVPVSAVLAGAIAGITGIADTLNRQNVRRATLRKDWT